jgi:hypothetical protein
MDRRSPARIARTSAIYFAQPGGIYPMLDLLPSNRLILPAEIPYDSTPFQSDAWPKYPDIRIVNLHYAETVETDVYVALRHRIGLFEQVVGGLQPILARMPSLISGRVLTGQGRGEAARHEAVREIEAEASRVQQGGGFDIDAVTDADLTEPP